MIPAAAMAAAMPRSVVLWCALAAEGRGSTGRVEQLECLEFHGVEMIC